jgi:hypothetical protein
MKDTKKIIALGILTALVPFLGFPSSWKNVLFMVLGLAIAGLGYRLLMHLRDARSDTVENTATTSNSVGTMSAHE